MNKGWRPAEIAEVIDLPPGLAERWSVRGYYGTVSHNVKAVYQRYLSAGTTAIRAISIRCRRRRRRGSSSSTWAARAAVIARAKADFAKGEFRWVAQVMKEVVYAEPDNIEARALCADALEQMGYQAESATWRNAFLYGAQELRHGVFKMPARGTLSADTLAGLSTDVFFDMLAIRLDPAKAAGQAMVRQLALHRSRREARADARSTARSAIGWANGRIAAAASITTTRATLDALVLGKLDDPGRAGVGRAEDRGRPVAARRPVRHARSAVGPDVRHPDAG